MKQITREFFAELEKQPALPGRQTGVLCIDLADGERTEHWYLDIRRGAIHVSHKGLTPDCVMSTDLATFEAIVDGRMNAMAAVLRGAIQIEGRFSLLIALQPFMAGPREALKRPTAGYARRRS
jgi:putative sterol carrier protein